MLGFYVSLRTAVLRSRLYRTGRDRGDVPGWVLITLMTAGLVTALWLVAGARLTALLGNALNISNPSSGATGH